MSTDFVIRPLTHNNQRDYQALARLLNYAYPEEPTTSFALKIADATREEKLICERWIAEENGIIKGTGGFEHWESFYHPNRYLLHIIVDEKYQNNGVGSALYNFVIGQVKQRQPEFVRTWAMQNRAGSVRFAEQREFFRDKLKWNITLDVQACNLAPFAVQAEAIKREGIAVKSVAELTEDFDHQSKLYELYARTINSINAEDEATPPSFDEFVSDENLIDKNVTFIALDADDYVGMWQLENQVANNLYGGILSVNPAYRKRGVAFALVFAAIKFAQINNYQTLTAHTDEHNKAVLTLAEKFGFTHLPAQILFSKKFDLKAVARA